MPTPVRERRRGQGGGAYDYDNLPRPIAKTRGEDPQRSIEFVMRGKALFGGRIFAGLRAAAPHSNADSAPRLGERLAFARKTV